MDEKPVGKVTHFFNKIMVAGIDITSGKLKVGNKIHIKGTTTDFEMLVDSMQIDRNPVEEATAGQSIGIKVPAPVREGDEVFVVTDQFVEANKALNLQGGLVIPSQTGVARVLFDQTHTDTGKLEDSLTLDTRDIEE